jgi:hypothetical protein
MAIYRLIASGSFDPDAVEPMIEAYESALSDLGLADRSDPLTDLLAKAIITVVSTGERSPDKIKERALNALGARKIDAALGASVGGRLR